MLVQSVRAYISHINNKQWGVAVLFVKMTLMHIHPVRVRNYYSRFHLLLSLLCDNNDRMCKHSEITLHIYGFRNYLCTTRTTELNSRIEILFIYF